MTGRIVKALSGFYYIDDGSSVIECRARGSLRHDKITPLVGDFVEYSATDKSLNRVLERKNHLDRPPVANVDKAFLVSAFENPNPNHLLIDTFIAVCEHKNIEPILVFNKSDQGDLVYWKEFYETVGYKVLITSVKESLGIDELFSQLKNSVSVFTGNSGVGKSSLINLLKPEAQLKTGEISEKLGRGRHTTRHTELFKLENGGYVADTAGFYGFEPDKTDYSFKENLPNCFIEFDDFSAHCRFVGCSHTTELGCAVIEAVNDKRIMPERFESYKTLYNDLKDLKKWQFSK